MSNSSLSPPEETEILDAAFQLAKDAISPHGHAEAKDKLQHLFPALSFDDITDMYLRASALADACYDSGDQCREKRMTEAQALAALRQRFPGFSSPTYESALSWGYFLSR